MEFKMSSVDFALFWLSPKVTFILGGLGIGPPFPIAATVGCCPTLGVVTLRKYKSSSQTTVHINFIIMRLMT